MDPIQELFEKTLHKMNSEGNFKASVLSMGDGLPLASSPTHYEDETAAAMVTLLNETVKRINNQLQLSQMDEICIVGDDRTRLVCRYCTVDGNELLLMILTLPDQTYRRLTNQAMREIKRIWLSQGTER